MLIRFDFYGVLFDTTMLYYLVYFKDFFPGFAWISGNLKGTLKNGMQVYIKNLIFFIDGGGRGVMNVG